MDGLSCMQNNLETDGDSRVSIITVSPQEVIPCYYCASSQIGLVRFLNATVGYQSFFISVGGQLAVSGLETGRLSDYGRVSAGLQMVSISDETGYVYLEKQICVPMDGAVTIAFINTDFGLDLVEIRDIFCNGGIHTGCFRVCNLSITNRRINVSLNSGLTFRAVGYRELTRFEYLLTGYYMVSVYSSHVYSMNIILNSNLYIRGNTSYTLYVFNGSSAQDDLRVLIVEDRRS